MIYFHKIQYKNEMHLNYLLNILIGSIIISVLYLMWFWSVSRTLGTSVHASVRGRYEDDCTALLCAKEMYNYVQVMCKLCKALWGGGEGRGGGEQLPKHQQNNNHNNKEWED